MSHIDVEAQKILVVPGEEIGDSSYKSGMGTYAREGKIYAAQLGIVNIRSGYINVLPYAGKYLPRQGDSIIGIIKDIGPNSWFVDINCPYNSLLHGNETQWKVEYGMTGQFLNVGDVILAKINQVDEIKRVNLTMKEHGLRKLNSGQIIRIDHTKVPRVIGKGGSMISVLKEKTGCRIFIGQNGVIWIDGELEGITKVTLAIDMIDKKPQMQGLTDAIREFLGTDDETGIEYKEEPPQEPAEGEEHPES